MLIDYSIFQLIAYILISCDHTHYPYIKVVVVLYSFSINLYLTRFTHEQTSITVISLPIVHAPTTT